MVLGGVEIPFDKGLLGHSDADVLLHAIADAVLGAAALGDIGKHFPPTDPAFKDADSLILLQHACALVRGVGYDINNIDATVVAEAPKILPHAESMRERIAAACGVATDDVSIKATTNERMGFVGREEGIAAMAIATIQREVGG
jgi:2-C-methyl-D-erythritol 2,4-cyclodiphosphate synthase